MKSILNAAGKSSTSRHGRIPILSDCIDVLEPIAMLLSWRQRLIAVEGEEGEFSFYKARGGRTAVLASSAVTDGALLQPLRQFGAGDVELRLPASKITVANLKIPAAAAQFASQLVESRLDRLTPWPPALTVHGYSVSHAPAPDGQCDVTVFVTSSQIVSRSVETLSKFGLTATSIASMAEALGPYPKINLLKEGWDANRQVQRRRIGASVVGATGLSLMAYLVSLYMVQESSWRIAEIEIALASSRARLIAVTAASPSRQRDASLIVAKGTVRAKFMTVAKLAEIIPDDTYLDELDLLEAGARISGTSTDAPRLIKVLEADDSLSDVKFSAPVTRQPDGRDHFDITANLVSRPNEVPE